jgi:hypothetical protein
MDVLKRAILCVSLAAGLGYGLAAMSADETKAADSKTTETKTTDSKAPGSGPNPYTDCGIGAALFPNTHWAAVTSNVIFDLGMTAITSATSSPQTCSGRKVEAAVFIHTTYDELVEETAAGGGEHVVAVLSLFGCDAVGDVGAIREVRNSMGQAVTAPDYLSQTRLQKAARYYSAVERAASHSCTA